MSQFHGLTVPAEVIAAAARGEHAAHEAIYRACSAAVFSLVRRLVPRTAVAEELLQEVFVEILRSIAAYTGEGAFSGWVRAITVNKCLMYLRSPWHRSLLWLDADDGGSESSPVVLLHEGAQPEAQATAGLDLERALARLPAITRTVIWLHDVEGYTHHEIAAALGRTTSFSKSQLARAHVRLRGWLDPSVEALPCTPVPNNC